MLAVLSAITMTYGNLVAMFQTNIKRLLGYSSISHAGYLLMGAAAGTALGASGINFYLLGYLFTNLAAFLVIIVFSIATKSDEIADYAGLSNVQACLACTMLLALVSLAGMPPLAGFFGKFTIADGCDQKRICLAGPDRRGQYCYFALLLFDGRQTHLC